jgi:hypothetical protein
MPTRVLELEPDSFRNGWIRLLVVPPGFKKAYASLSYCWGDVQNIRLTRDVMDQFTADGIPLSYLPATIKDACELCIGIGIKYLWVCSLCILQDLEIDWLQQSSMMATIYNCADLTISVARGHNCNAGVFGERRSGTLSFATIRWQKFEGGHGTCCVRGLEPSGYKEPTMRRGWTLQENLLSRRLLTRETVQLTWQCTTSQWNQSGTLRLPSLNTKDIFPCAPLRYPIDPYGVRSSEGSLKEGLVLGVWQELVSVYCRRNLSLPKDKLPAISGLAKWLSRNCSIEERYLAGLWRSQFPECLLWHTNLVFPADEAQARKAIPYRAPSWTWASLDSKYIEWFPSTSQEKVAKALDCDLSYKSTDPFGEVTDGYLDIEAPMQEGWLVPIHAYPEQFEFWDEDWRHDLSYREPSHLNKSLGRVRLDVYNTADLLVVNSVSREDRAHECECLRITTRGGLLVSRLEEAFQEGESKRLYRRQRIGIVEFKENKALEWWRGAPKKVVRLL